MRLGAGFEGKLAREWPSLVITQKGLRSERLVVWASLFAEGSAFSVQRRVMTTSPFWVLQLLSRTGWLFMKRVHGKLPVRCLAHSRCSVTVIMKTVPC